jgi:hypothetical protein
MRSSKRRSGHDYAWLVGQAVSGWLRSLKSQMGRDLMEGSPQRLKGFACRAAAARRQVWQGSLCQLLGLPPQGGVRPVAAPGLTVCAVPARSMSGG